MIAGTDRLATYRFLRLRLHCEVILVQAALRLLLACPAAGALALAVGRLLRRVPVADGAVALIEELVVRHVVLLDVPLDEVEVPREEGVQLVQSGLVDLEGL